MMVMAMMEFADDDHAGDNARADDGCNDDVDGEYHGNDGHDDDWTVLNGFVTVWQTQQIKYLFKIVLTQILRFGNS